MKVLHILRTRTTTVYYIQAGGPQHFSEFLLDRGSHPSKPSPSSFCHGKNRSVPTEYCLGTYTTEFTSVQRPLYSVDNDDGPVWTQCMHCMYTRPRIACCHSSHPSAIVIVIVAFIMLSCIIQLPVADPPAQQMQCMISQPANPTAEGRLSLSSGVASSSVHPPSITLSSVSPATHRPTGSLTT
ncbi:hypothetical protein CGRA01v4_02348 [Colletotrichum graminicola]|nr:hypothetical protein CGRA01v4_02348 [Colletotrichum graminicola]